MTARRLAFGTLAPSGSDTTIYTVPRHSRAVNAALILTNVSNDDVEVSVRASAGGSKFRVLPARLVIHSGDSFHLITPFSIEQNETLSLEASTANAVEYYFTGYFETAIPVSTERAE